MIEIMKLKNGRLPPTLPIPHPTTAKMPPDRVPFYALDHEAMERAIADTVPFHLIIPVYGEGRAMVADERGRLVVEDEDHTGLNRFPACYYSSDSDEPLDSNESPDSDESPGSDDPDGGVRVGTESAHESAHESVEEPIDYSIDDSIESFEDAIEELFQESMDELIYELANMPTQDRATEFNQDRGSLFYSRYRTMEAASLRLQKEAKGYLDSLRGTLTDLISNLTFQDRG
jgi:hypothetical protein